MASCPLLLPASCLLLRHPSSCVLGSMPEGVDLLEASVLAPLHTLPPRGDLECPLSSGQKHKGVKGSSRELLLRGLQRDGRVKAPHKASKARKSAWGGAYGVPEWERNGMGLRLAYWSAVLIQGLRCTWGSGVVGKGLFKVFVRLMSFCPGYPLMPPPDPPSLPGPQHTGTPRKGLALGAKGQDVRL